MCASGVSASAARGRGGAAVISALIKRSMKSAQRVISHLLSPRQSSLQQALGRAPVYLLATLPPRNYVIFKTSDKIKTGWIQIETALMLFALFKVKWKMKCNLRNICNGVESAVFKFTLNSKALFESLFKEIVILRVTFSNFTFLFLLEKHYNNSSKTHSNSFHGY